jgi:hypothetical protein
MMLRSAEADPHVIEHAIRAQAEAVVRVHAKPPPTNDAEASSFRDDRAGSRRGHAPDHPSGERSVKDPKVPDEVVRGRGRGPLVDLQGDYRSGRQDSSSSKSRRETDLKALLR